MATRVLLVDDEVDLALALQEALRGEGYDVAWLDRGGPVADAVRTAPPQLVILDRKLPDAEGLEICRALRAGGYDGGVLLLTAQGAEAEIAAGLDGGADDYIVKPFGLVPFLARVRALLRRTAAMPGQRRVIRIDAAARKVQVDQHEVALSAREFEIMRVLHARRNSVVTREELTGILWPGAWYGSPRTLDVAVGRLRRKLEEAGLGGAVVTVRGVGFRLDTSSDEPVPD